MRKTLFALSLAALFVAPITQAQPNDIDRPPVISEKAAKAAFDGAQGERPTTNYERVGQKAKRHEADPGLAPTAADYEKARKDRAMGHYEKPMSKQTQIEAVRDQHNQIREYVVTPGSTHIPYTMDNRADRPASADPGRSKDTLGTPKFIRFGF